MNETVRIDILKVIKSAISMIERDNIFGLKDLSNQTIHNSSIFQDNDSVGIAVIMYTLSKIFDRQKNIDKSVINILIKAKNSLFDYDIERFRRFLKKLFALISKEDKKTKMYLQEVISQAGVRKGSKIYDHGISLAQSANILGVSQWDMMDYLGKTKIADTFKEPINLRRRLATARKIFGG